MIDKLYLSLVMIGAASVLLFAGKPRAAYYTLQIGLRFVTIKAQYHIHDSCLSLAIYGTLITIILIMGILIVLTLLIQ